MATIELRVRPRTVLGKKVRAMRRQGIVPANIYGRGLQSLAIEVPLLDVRHAIQEAGRTHLVQIVVEGEPQPRPTLIRKVQRKPTTDEILHVDFQQVSLREKMTVTVPVVLTGTAPVVERGDGVVVEALAQVEVECLPTAIPEHLEGDLSVLTDFDSHVKVSDLRVPPGVTVLTDPNLVVASVSRTAAAEEEAAAAAAAAEEAAEPAAEQSETEE
jgi:large subunit ribosomal protein L25